MTAKQYKELRKKHGTQKEVAELLGVSRQLVGMRESGDATITREAEMAIRSLTTNQ
tara:strand:+ start:7304 stop:7471 length:168 start_codon:yes stop_codon:yes gene_type:complete